MQPPFPNGHKFPFGRNGYVTAMAFGKRQLFQFHFQGTSRGSERGWTWIKFTGVWGPSLSRFQNRKRDFFSYFGFGNGTASFLRALSSFFLFHFRDSDLFWRIWKWDLSTCRSSQIFHFSADKVWSKPVFRFLFLYWNQVKYIYPIDGNIAIIFQLVRTSRNMVTSRPHSVF